MTSVTRNNNSRIKALSLLSILLLLITGCNVQNNVGSEQSEYYDTILQELTQFKKEHKIQGMAFAIFDESRIIEEICLGTSTYGHPINAETLFSIQSISKNFTAMAVMIAVQDSLVDLKTPISEYLAEFTVNSCYEANPEGKITIEMLLSHTAGFTHEAPIGNNFDYRQVDFDEHINSISETWLKFPAGMKYAYSNLGYDLTTRILARRSGMSFDEYLLDKIFQPLNMSLTSIEGQRLLSKENRTEGIIPFIKTSHYPIPLIGSGAVYTNLTDLIIYTQFQMNQGRALGQPLLAKEHLQNMYTIRTQNYGLGSYINKSGEVHFVNHNGGGYGYTSTMVFFPEYHLGIILLCNGGSPTWEVCESIIHQYIDQSESQKDPEMTEMFDEVNNGYFNNPISFNVFKNKYCEGETTYKNEWDRYLGTYALMYPGYLPKWYTSLAINLGYRPQKLWVYEDNQNLMIKGWFGESNLREYTDGLFFMEDGEVVDFSGDTATYRNIKLEKRK